MPAAPRRLTSKIAGGRWLNHARYSSFWHVGRRLTGATVASSFRNEREKEENGHLSNVECMVWFALRAGQERAAKNQGPVC